MEPLKRFLIAMAAVLWIVPIVSGAAGARDESLYSQASSVLLEREFPDARISYLLVDLASGRHVAERWDDPAKPIAVGSLAKPFELLAYAKHHREFPQFTCKGTSDRCWLPRGHGRIGASAALAQSCNSYFRKLTRQTPREDMDEVVAQYGLGPLPPTATRSAFYGMSADWKMTPQQLVDAYEKIANMQDRGSDIVRTGMLLSAKDGTGKGLRDIGPGGVMDKTGTAPCSHAQHAQGDGFVVVLFPADQPRNLLLVRLHGSTGANSAKIAAQMLSRLAETRNAAR